MVPGTHDSDTTPLAGRALIIDDDDLIARSLRHVLMGRGCEVDLARDRAFAEELLFVRRYDVVILDPFLTGEVQADGTLVATVCRLQADARVVILSAYMTPSVTGPESPRVTMVRKPQPVQHLSRLVARLLDPTPESPTAPAGSENELENREVDDAT